MACQEVLFPEDAGPHLIAAFQPFPTPERAEVCGKMQENQIRLSSSHERQQAMCVARAEADFVCGNEARRQDVTLAYAQKVW